MKAAPKLAHQLLYAALALTGANVITVFIPNIEGSFSVLLAAAALLVAGWGAYIAGTQTLGMVDWARRIVVALGGWMNVVGLLLITTTLDPDAGVASHLAYHVIWAWVLVEAATVVMYFSFGQKHIVRVLTEAG